MVDISVVSVNGEQRENPQSPLPFKKPDVCSLRWRIINTTKTFVFKASVLNMTALRVIAETPTNIWTFVLSFFPAVAIVSIICVQTEFTIREWVYYRMLEHNVIIDFPAERNSCFSLLQSAAAMWTLAGTLLLCSLMIYDKSSSGIGMQGWPYTEMLNVATMAYLMIDAVHAMRQITKRFPNVNTLILGSKAGDREDTLAWIRQLEVMREDAVQFHFLHVKEADQAASSNRGSTSDVPQNGVSEGIDFAKVGKAGYTAESVKQLRSGSLKPQDCLTAFKQFIAGSQWARLAPSNLYVVKADVEFNEQMDCTMRYCIAASLGIMVLGIGSENALGKLGQDIWATVKNATAS